MADTPAMRAFMERAKRLNVPGPSAVRETGGFTADDIKRAGELAIDYYLEHGVHLTALTTGTVLQK